MAEKKPPKKGQKKETKKEVNKDVKKAVKKEPEQKVVLPKLTFEENRVLRRIDNPEDAKIILSVLNKYGNIKKHVVDTKLTEDGTQLEHRRIKHIIHSGEFTETMAYDVSRLALDMAGFLVKSGLYTNNMLPHSFTLENGKWILYDFDVFSIHSKVVKNQIMNTFKVQFANYEIIKTIKRGLLKHYFLNKISFEHLSKMISFEKWLGLSIKMIRARIMNKTGQFEKLCNFLKQIQHSYDDKHQTELYNYAPTDYDMKIYNHIDTLIRTQEDDILCIGLFGGDWALISDNSLHKMVYIDNYDICDEYYNYIRKNKISNISTAVLQPLTKDKSLKNNLKYRALYDDYTVKRFASNTVILDFDEVFDGRYFSVNEFCSTIAKYSLSSMIIKIDKSTPELEAVKEVLSGKFRSVNVTEVYNYEIIELKDINGTGELPNIDYKNENRDFESEEQNQAILKIING